MGTHVMLDLETFSSKKNAFIISIGAVKFDPLDDEILDMFHQGVSAKAIPLIGEGFHVDPATVAWWMAADQDPGRAAWNALDKLDLGTVLEGFSMWYGEDNKVPVWGNGATFDNVILRNAYEAMGLHCPWSFRADRCYRTMREIAPEVAFDPLPLDGPQHDALADATRQARHLQRVMAKLVGWRS